MSTGLPAFLCSSAWRSMSPPYCCINDEPSIPAKAATGATSGKPTALTPAAARRAAAADSAICGACSSSAPGICLKYSPTAGSSPFSLYFFLTASNPGCSPKVSLIAFCRSAAFSAALLASNNDCAPVSCCDKTLAAPLPILAPKPGRSGCGGTGKSDISIRPGTGKSLISIIIYSLAILKTF